MNQPFEPDELCQPGDYGSCRACKRQVALVIGSSGQRFEQFIIDEQTADGRQWTCEQCIKTVNDFRPEWNPDEITQLVLIDPDPLLNKIHTTTRSFLKHVGILR